MADLHGLFNDPHTGVALAALIKQSNSGIIGKNDSVVVISTAHGLKFQEFKSGYHAGSLADVSGRFRNRLVTLPADANIVRTTMDKFLKRA